MLRGVQKGACFVDSPGGVWLNNWSGWDPTRASEELDQIKSWGANVIRIFEVNGHWLRNTVDSNGYQHRDVVVALANLCARKGMYLILTGFSAVGSTEQGNQQDPLPYPPYLQSGLPTQLFPDTQAWINVWADIANTLKGIPSVILEPHNEPHLKYPDGTWGNNPNEWFVPLQQTINAMRATGYDGLIIYQYRSGTWVNLDYPQARSDLGWVEDHPITDPINNLVISTHQYRFYNAIGLWTESHGGTPSNPTQPVLKSDIMQALIYELIPHVLNDLNKPIIIGECGASMDYTGTAYVDELQACTNQLELYQELGLHYIGFWWRSELQFRLISDDRNPETTPTESGSILRNSLLNQIS